MRIGEDSWRSIQFSYPFRHFIRTLIPLIAWNWNYKLLEEIFWSNENAENCQCLSIVILRNLQNNHHSTSYSLFLSIRGTYPRNEETGAGGGWQGMKKGRDKLCSFCLYDYEHFFVWMSSLILLATLYRSYFWRHVRVHTKENNKAVKHRDRSWTSAIIRGHVTYERKKIIFIILSQPITTNNPNE